jgi:uncharacterized membrane protein
MAVAVVVAVAVAVAVMINTTLFRASNQNSLVIGKLAQKAQV